MRFFHHSSWKEGYDAGVAISERGVVAERDRLMRVYENQIAEKDEVIEFLRIELQASRDREGWYQRCFQEERERSNQAADILIQENGRRPLTHIADQIESAKTARLADAKKKIEEEDDPFRVLPFGDPNGMFATAEEAQGEYPGEV